MRNFVDLAVFFLALSIFCGFGESVIKAETAATTVAQAKSETRKEPEALPNPMRSVCAYSWNRLYENRKAEIRVSTRGEYDETVVFTCPDCSLEENFVNPFLNAEYEGKSGIARIKECGFTKAVFKGARGIQEIGRRVP